MKFIDFFAGIGVFRIGMEMAGHECVGHCEIDKYADMSYRMMHTVTEEQRQELMAMSLKDRQKEIRCALCAGMSHGTTNQPANYVLVIDDEDNDGEYNSDWQYNRE